MIQQYLDWNRKNLRSKRSRIEYARDLTIFQRWLGKPLTEATKLDIETYKRTCAVGNRTTNRKLSVIRSFYSFLTTTEVIKANPAEGIKGVRMERKHIPKVLTPAALDLLFTYSLFPHSSYKEYLTKIIFKTFYYTGIRLSELINLSLGDIDFTNRRMTVTGKGNLTRIVKFPESLSQDLSSYMLQRIRANEPAFFQFSNGERLNIQRVWYFFTKFRRRTGLHVTPHSLRHTFASYALSRGMDLAQVQEILGHSEVSTTSIYIGIARSIEKSYDEVFP